MSWAGLSSPQILLLLCFAAGFVHVMAPDHWAPASIVGWQRDWRRWQFAAFAAVAMILHVGLGSALYFILRGLWSRLGTRELVAATGLLIAGFTWFRSVRLTGLEALFRRAPAPRDHAWRGVLALLGPAEILVPILAKGRQLGMGYLPVILVFLAATWIGAGACMIWGQRAWNQPIKLARFMNWVQERHLLPPVAAGLAVGLTFLWGLK